MKTSKSLNEIFVSQIFNVEKDKIFICKLFLFHPLHV